MQTSKISSRDYIRSAGGRLYIELIGSVTRGFTPRIVGETLTSGFGRVEDCCAECGAELAETMTFDLSDNDAKRYIACEACGNKYLLRTEQAQ